MPPTLRAGLTLGLAVTAWTFVMGFTGWYKQPGLILVSKLIIVLLIASMVIWALRGTASQDGFGRQVWNGVSISLLGSMIFYGASLLFTKVVFPTYIQDMEALGRQLMAKQGLGAAQIEAAVQAQAPMQTHSAYAMAGVLVTMFTGFLTSVVASIWMRRK